MMSAEKSDEEASEEELGKFDAWIDRKFGDKAMKAVTITGTVLGVALAVLLFSCFPPGFTTCWAARCQPCRIIRCSAPDRGRDALAILSAMWCFLL